MTNIEDGNMTWKIWLSGAIHTFTWPQSSKLTLSEVFFSKVYGKIISHSIEREKMKSIMAKLLSQSITQAESEIKNKTGINESCRLKLLSMRVYGGVLKHTLVVIIATLYNA